MFKWAVPAIGIPVAAIFFALVAGYNFGEIAVIGAAVSGGIIYSSAGWIKRLRRRFDGEKVPFEMEKLGKNMTTGLIIGILGYGMAVSGIDTQITGADLMIGGETVRATIASFISLVVSFIGIAAVAEKYLLPNPAPKTEDEFPEPVEDENPPDTIPDGNSVGEEPEVTA